MKAVNYVGNIRRVIPVSHVAKSRRLKGDVDSYLAGSENFGQMLEKAKKKRITGATNELGTYMYSTQASEIFFVEVHQFDSKA